MSANELRTVSDIMSTFQLRELDIRDNQGIRGFLFILFTNSYPTLQSLKLGNSRLQRKDMESLALACEQGKLPNLRHLFLHTYTPESIFLFTGREKWNQLLTLRIGGCNVLGLESECLVSLQSLDIRRPGITHFTIKQCWPHLQTIKSDNELLLSEVVEGVKKGLFPALKIVRGSTYVALDFGFELHKANITYIRD